MLVRKVSSVIDAQCDYCGKKETNKDEIFKHWIIVWLLEREGLFGVERIKECRRYEAYNIPKVEKSYCSTECARKDLESKLSVFLIDEAKN